MTDFGTDRIAARVTTHSEKQVFVQPQHAWQFPRMALLRSRENTILFTTVPIGEAT